jgi:hypothetical protein
MRVAEVLSDLTSLRVCVRPSSSSHNTPLLTPLKQEPAAAQALVSARPSPPSSSVDAVKQKTAAIQKESKDEDPDLQRAKDLVDLHYAVKASHGRGSVDKSLEDAKRDVERVLRGVDG